MAKAPAFQLYPGDWFREPGLKIVDLSVRGAWAELLMIMFELEPQGILDASLQDLSSLLRITLGKSAFILNELIKYEICNHQFYPPESYKTLEKMAGQYFTLAENCGKKAENFGKMEKIFQQIPVYFRIISRRQFKDWKAKNNDRLRKQKRGGRISNSDEIPFKFQKISAQYLLSSSSSSLLSKDNKPDLAPLEQPSADSFLDEIKDTSNHFSVKVGAYFESIKNSCDALVKLSRKNGKKFNPFQYTQTQVNNKKHPGAINDTLKGLISMWDFIRDPNPWGYADKILQTKNQNWNEKEAIAIHEYYKTLNFQEFNRLTQGILKPISDT